MESKSYEQPKCVLCRRDITKEPIVKLLNDRRLAFDKSECEAIFDRLTSVYGTNFGLQFTDL